MNMQSFIAAGQKYGACTFRHVIWIATSVGISLTVTITHAGGQRRCSSHFLGQGKRAIQSASLQADPGHANTQEWLTGQCRQCGARLPT